MKSADEVFAGFDFLREERFAEGPRQAEQLEALCRFDMMAYSASHDDPVGQAFAEVQALWRMRGDFERAYELLRLSRDTMMPGLSRAVAALQAALRNSGDVLSRLAKPQNAQLFIRMEQFWRPILLLAAAGYWRDLEALAALAQEPGIVTEGLAEPPAPSYRDALPAAYLAALRGDLDRVQRLLPVPQSEAEAKRPLIYRHYDQLLLAAARGDQGVFDELLRVVVQAFAALSASKLSPDEWYWGWGKLGALMSIDLQGLAIVKLAIRLGLAVRVDSPQMPAALMGHSAD